MLFALSNCVFNLILFNYFSVFILKYLSQVFTSTTCIRFPKLMCWAQWFAREKEMTSSVMEVLSYHCTSKYLHSTTKYYECMQVHDFIVLVIVLFLVLVRQVHLGLLLCPDSFPDSLKNYSHIL